MMKHLKNRWKHSSFILEVKDSINKIFFLKESDQPVDLRGIVVGLDGAIPELLNADFRTAKLSGQVFGYSKFSCSFNHGHFSSVDFSLSYFDTCDFIKSIFLECSFAQSKISSPTLDDAIFQNCTFHSAKISGRGFTEYGGRRTTFKNCVFNNCTFKNLEIRGCKFIDCNFDGVLFDTCIITGTSFLGSTAPPSAFSRCEGQIPQ